VPRVPALERSDIPDHLAPVLERVGETYGFVPNSMLTMGHNPELLEAFSALGRVAMGDGSSIPAGLRWLVAHVASRASGCRYCIAHTAHNGAAAAGLEAAKFEAVWEFETSPLFDDAERAALRVAAAAGSVPNETTDAMFHALRSHYSDREVVDIVAAVAFFGFLNRWNDTMATALEGAPLQFAAQHLAKSGWTPGKHVTPDHHPTEPRHQEEP
jgi:uncharacterized peroxidase-related enzyme